MQLRTKRRRAGAAAAAAAPLGANAQYTTRNTPTLAARIASSSVTRATLRARPLSPRSVIAPTTRVMPDDRDDDRHADESGGRTPEDQARRRATEHSAEGDARTRGEAGGGPDEPDEASGSETQPTAGRDRRGPSDRVLQPGHESDERSCHRALGPRIVGEEQRGSGSHEEDQWRQGEERAVRDGSSFHPETIRPHTGDHLKERRDDRAAGAREATLGPQRRVVQPVRDRLRQARWFRADSTLAHVAEGRCWRRSDRRNAPRAA